MSKEMGFEQVWQQILEVAEINEKKGIYTLGRDVHSRGVHNQIVEINENYIVVISEKPLKSPKQKRRKLKKEGFQCLWNTLRKRGQLDVYDIKEECNKQYHQKTGRIMMAFLAQLESLVKVDWPINPVSKRRRQTLYPCFSKL